MRWKWAKTQPNVDRVIQANVPPISHSLTWKSTDFHRNQQHINESILGTGCVQVSIISGPSQNTEDSAT